MNYIKKTAICMIFLLLVFLTACGTENEPEQSTSINDYETLEMKEDESPSELEIYELFMNGELTVEKKQEQLTINELIDTSECIEPSEIYTKVEMLERLAE